MFLEKKLFLLNVASEEIDQSDNSCRQLLITASPILCSAIRQSYYRLCNSDPVVRKSLPEDEDALYEIPNTFQDCNDSKYPLIITNNHFLAMVHDSLPNSFFSKNGSDTREVTFDRFCSHYCIHFDEKLYGDANLKYMEFMTTIKGSLESLYCPNGYLSEDKYLSLCSNRHSSLTEGQRRMIYKAFLKYEKLKGEYNDYDQLDLAHFIYRSLDKCKAANLPNLQSVFVDEVQDLTPVQISIFQFICKNPSGFLFAGDTAQTVRNL
jgi:hypothetical protein